MPSMSAEMAARLIQPHLPNEAIQVGIPAQRAAFVAQAAFVRTGIDITVTQVYAGVGWLREHPVAGALPLITEPGPLGGYSYASDPARVQRGLTPLLRDLHTRMYRRNRGVIVPYADLVLAPINPQAAADLRQDFADALAAVGRHV